MAVNISGLLNQFQWIPLWAVNGPLELRFTLQDTRACIVLRPANGSDMQPHAYKLIDIAMHASLCALARELQAKYVASVASGESLLMHIANSSHNQLFISPIRVWRHELCLGAPAVSPGHDYVLLRAGAYAD